MAFKISKIDDAYFDGKYFSDGKFAVNLEAIERKLFQATKEYQALINAGVKFVQDRRHPLATGDIETPDIAQYFQDIKIDQAIPINWDNRRGIYSEGQWICEFEFDGTKRYIADEYLKLILSIACMPVWLPDKEYWGGIYCNEVVFMVMPVEVAA